ncbi:MAG: penicillin-binding protein 2 [Candidatus Harrisonbacteria bacterium]|nr:penicillin-binding protein 2 [Candidatus Harrisonbacteria bacterium]
MRDEFDLEHAIIESNTKHYEVLELPLSRQTFQLLGVTAVVLSGIVLLRVFYLAGERGDFYKTRADMNVEDPITIPAIRGSIHDRFGELLAGNESSYRVVLNVGLAKRDSFDLDTVLEDLSEVLEIDKAELLSAVTKADLEKSGLITLGRNLSSEQVEAIKKIKVKALEIQDDYRRNYIKGPAFSHVLGYTGLAKFNDLRGKAGLEKYYDEVLSGSDGVRLMYRDARGNILDEKLLDEPKNGAHVYTTIDAGLQEYFYNRLSEALRSLGRNAGVGIALNPQNGEVLAMVNAPSFDNNVFTRTEESKKRAALLNASFEPLFNRAVSGVYTPGSTVKPMVALAALNEQVITPQKQIYSAGFIEIPNPYFPDQPGRFLDWKAHGWVDLRSAIARSSNVYFYEVGGGLPGQGSESIKGLGIDKLKEYWQKFGFGEKTGIDLDAESVGFLPDPEEKEIRTKDIWRLGDTYNVSIGQGDFQVTPIQLIAYIASFADGGKYFKPHIIKKIVKSEKGKEDMVLREVQPELSRDFSYLGNYLKEVREGMKDTVRKPYGTAHLLADLPISVAGKTGSSQVANNTRTNAFFVAYAPADNPQIAILVLIENAKEGSLNAVPVGKDVLNWYYWNRLTK